jgi:hypothetical protein
MAQFYPSQSKILERGTKDAIRISKEALFKCVRTRFGLRIVEKSVENPDCIFRSSFQNLRSLILCSSFRNRRLGVFCSPCESWCDDVSVELTRVMACLACRTHNGSLFKGVSTRFGPRTIENPFKHPDFMKCGFSSTFNHSPSKTDEFPPNIYRKNVCMLTVNFWVTCLSARFVQQIVLRLNLRAIETSVEISTFYLLFILHKSSLGRVKVHAPQTTIFEGRTNVSECLFGAHSEPYGKQHFRDIPTPDFVSKCTNPAYYLV